MFIPRRGKCPALRMARTGTGARVRIGWYILWLAACPVTHPTCIMTQRARKVVQLESCWRAWNECRFAVYGPHNPSAVEFGWIISHDFESKKTDKTYITTCPCLTSYWSTITSFGMCWIGKIEIISCFSNGTSTTRHCMHRRSVVRICVRCVVY